MFISSLVLVFSQSEGTKSCQGLWQGAFQRSSSVSGPFSSKHVFLQFWATLNNYLDIKCCTSSLIWRRKEKVDKRKPGRNNLHPHDQESPPPNNPWLKKKIIKLYNNFDMGGYMWKSINLYSGLRRSCKSSPIVEDAENTTFMISPGMGGILPFDGCNKIMSCKKIWLFILLLDINRISPKSPSLWLGVAATSQIVLEWVKLKITKVKVVKER